MQHNISIGYNHSKLHRKGPITDFEQESDDNEDKDDESGEQFNDRCDSNGTVNDLEDMGECKAVEDSQNSIKKDDSPHQSSIQISASSYAALFTASSKEQIESARNIIRVPAHRPHLPTLSLQNTVSSDNGINTSTSVDVMTTLPHALLPTSTSHMGSIPTEYLPWTPFRPFSTALPGYLPIQAGFLGPKFGGKSYIFFILGNIFKKKYAYDLQST